MHFKWVRGILGFDDADKLAKKASKNASLNQSYIGIPLCRFKLMAKWNNDLETKKKEQLQKKQKPNGCTTKVKRLECFQDVVKCEEASCRAHPSSMKKNRETITGTT